METNQIGITCCFIGYSTQNYLNYVKLEELLRKEILWLITEKGVQHFISSMGIGTDIMAAKIVLELKKKYQVLTLESAIAYEKRAVGWTKKQKNEYFDILSRCEKETMLQREYSPDCLSLCNEYMVNKSEYVIAVWNGRSNRTKDTVMYARQLNRCLTIINPSYLLITRENSNETTQ